MAWFNEWWNGLDSFTLQVFYCIAIPSTVFLLIQAILIIFGGIHGGDGDFSGGHDGDFSGGGHDGDFGHDGGHDCGHDGDFGHHGHGHGHSDFNVLSMFTVQGISTMMSVFGWSAILLFRGGLPLIVTIPASIAIGVAVMFVIAKIMFSLTKLNQSGTLDVKNLLGSMGTVYLKIPEKGAGKGKVMIQTSERLVEFEAVSEGSRIPNNAPIRVIDILGENVLVVEPQ